MPPASCLGQVRSGEQMAIRDLEWVGQTQDQCLGLPGRRHPRRVRGAEWLHVLRLRRPVLLQRLTPGKRPVARWYRPRVTASQRS